MKNAGEPVEFGPGENLGVIAVIFRIGRAAIDAAEIATIRDGNAQVRDLAAESIVEGHKKTRFLPSADWNRDTPKNTTFPVKPLLSKLRNYRRGGAVVSSRALIPAKRGIAPRAVGFLSARPKESELQTKCTPVCLRRQTPAFGAGEEAHSSRFSFCVMERQ